MATRFRIVPEGLTDWRVEHYQMMGVVYPEKKVTKTLLFGLIRYTGSETVREEYFEWTTTSLHLRGELGCYKRTYTPAIFPTIEAAKAAIDKVVAYEQRIEQQKKAIEARKLAFPPEEYP